MKTIYVTVAEFLENGGRLAKKRPIFNSIEGGHLGLYSPHEEQSKDQIVISLTIGKLLVCDNTDCYVSINCTPIYE